MSYPMLRFVASQEGRREQERRETRDERGEQESRRAGEQIEKHARWGRSWSVVASPGTGPRACLMRMECEGMREDGAIGLVRGNR